MPTPPLASSLPESAARADVLASASELREAARSYVQAARAERTRAAYRAQWTSFERFCREHDLPALPAAPETVALYLTARAQSGRRVATLAQALAAICHVQQRFGQPSPRTSALVRETWRGIRRTHGCAAQQKRPLLAQELRLLLRSLPDTLLGARDRALLALGFAGAFRRAELVALELDDLSFTSEGVVVSLRRSKSDQEGHGRKLGVPFGRAAESCPVRALSAWVTRAGQGSGPLFRSVDRHGNLGSALSGRDVARIVKRAAASAGLDPRELAGHSLRAGLVTSAAQAGKSSHAIMKTTGHRSLSMVQRYVRDAELFRDNAASDLL